jgi:hypothetical protein
VAILIAIFTLLTVSLFVDEESVVALNARERVVVLTALVAVKIWAGPVTCARLSAPLNIALTWASGLGILNAKMSSTEAFSALIFLSATVNTVRTAWMTLVARLSVGASVVTRHVTLGTDASVNELVESAVAETADFCWAVFTSLAITDEFAEVLDAVTPVV